MSRISKWINFYKKELKESEQVNNPSETYICLICDSTSDKGGFHNGGKRLFICNNCIFKEEAPHILGYVIGDTIVDSLDNGMKNLNTRSLDFADRFLEKLKKDVYKAILRAVDQN